MQVAGVLFCDWRGGFQLNSALTSLGSHRNHVHGFQSDDDVAHLKIRNDDTMPALDRDAKDNGDENG